MKEKIAGTDYIHLPQPSFEHTSKGVTIIYTDRKFRDFLKAQENEFPPIMSTEMAIVPGCLASAVNPKNKSTRN